MKRWNGLWDLHQVYCVFTTSCICSCTKFSCSYSDCYCRECSLTCTIICIFWEYYFAAIKMCHKSIMSICGCLVSILVSRAHVDIMEVVQSKNRYSYSTFNSDINISHHEVRQLQNSKIQWQQKQQWGMRGLILERNFKLNMAEKS